MHFPRLNQTHLQELRKRGFEAIGSRNLAKITTVRYALSSQVAKEFVAMNRPLKKEENTSSTHKIKKAIEQIVKDDFFQVKQQIKPDYQAWYKALRNDLDQNEFWNALSSKSEEKETIRLEWQKQDKYKFYRSEALIFIHTSILPVLINWLKYARREYNYFKRNLTSELAKGYGDYLNHVQEFINYHKNALHTSMLARLEATVAENDIRFDDVTVSTLHKLEERGIIKQTQTPDYPLRGMTPNTYHRFNFILQTQGTHQERIRLRAMADHHKKSIVSKTFEIKVDKKIHKINYLVPLESANYVATKLPFYLKLPRFLQGFFIGQKIRHEFFQNENAQYLLAAHSTIEGLTLPEDISLENVLQCKLLRDGRYFDMLITCEHERYARAMKDLSSPIFRNERRLLIGYEHQLKSSSETLIHKRLDLLEKIIHRIEQREEILTSEQQNNLTCLLSELKNRAEQTGLHIRYTHLEARCEQAVFALTERVKIREAQENRSSAISLFNRRRNIENEIQKNPFLLEDNAFTRHIEILGRAFNKLAGADSDTTQGHSISYLDVYRYVHRIFTVLCSLETKDEFNACHQRLTTLVALLKRITTVSKTLQSVITVIEKAITSQQHFDWEVLVDYTLAPEKDALERFIQNQSNNNVSNNIKVWETVERVVNGQHVTTFSKSNVEQDLNQASDCAIEEKPTVHFSLSPSHSV